jgi:hypothetical protein
MNFKNTDIVVINAPEHDFPLFRKFLIDHHHLFNKIHYVYSYNSRSWSSMVNGPYDYTHITQKTLPFANFIWADHNDMETYRKDGKLTDFRDHAQNVGLDASNSDAILFIEPDIRLDSLDYLLNLPDTFDVVAHCDGEPKLSPSLFWIKRSIIDKTSRWFTSTPEPLFYPMRKMKEGINSKLPISERIYTEPEPCGGDHFRFFNSEVYGLTTNMHLFDHDSYAGYIHYGAIITTAYHFRHNDYYVDVYGQRHLLHGSVIEDWIDRSLNCGVQQDERFIKEWTTHLANIERLRNV